MKQKSSYCQHLGQVSHGVSRVHFCGASHRHLFNLVILSAVVAIVLFGAALRTAAQLTILHSFGDGTVANDGSTPQDGLIQTPDGNFYGVTFDHAPGGPKGSTIFRITPSGVLNIVESFNNPHMESVPFYYNDKLIGYYFGSYKKNPGVVFSLTGYPNGPWQSHIWHIFTGEPSDGGGPVGRLILGSDGDLYGVTDNGGTANQGAIYKVDPKSHEVEVVNSFPSSSSLLRPNTSLLLAADGNFYGGASPVGSNPGEIYKMTPNGNVTAFYQFSGSEGPWGALIQGSDGNFYGTGYGIRTSFAYQLTTSGVFTVLHKFTPTKGHTSVETVGVIQGPNGYLYGVASGDGTAGKGMVYELSTDGSTFNVLHNFGDGSVPNDGGYPIGILTVGTDGNLYGVTPNGGSAGYGTVFKISP